VACEAGLLALQHKIFALQILHRVGVNDVFWAWRTLVVIVNLLDGNDGLSFTRPLFHYVRVVRLRIILFELWVVVFDDKVTLNNSPPPSDMLSFLRSIGLRGFPPDVVRDSYQWRVLCCRWLFGVQKRFEFRINRRNESWVRNWYNLYPLFEDGLSITIERLCFIFTQSIKDGGFVRTDFYFSFVFFDDGG